MEIGGSDMSELITEGRDRMSLEWGGIAVEQDWIT